MTPIEWLEKNVPGFKQLSAAQRESIMHFSLLCSAFEGIVLGTEGNSGRIIALATGWETPGSLTNADDFSEELQYFRDRYVQGGNFTHHYTAPDTGLRVAARDKGLVERVLKSGQASPGEIVAALLIIVYRLRNNLFHGTKWVYDNMNDQDDNFRHASSVLMRTADLVADARKRTEERYQN